MSTEANKALVHRVFDEVYTNGDLATINELFAADFVRHRSTGPDTTGTDAMKQYIVGIRTVFPDLCVVVDDLVAESDKVVARLTVRGTQRASYMGVAPTGRFVSIVEIQTMRLAGGRIAEAWVLDDGFGLLNQLSSEEPAEPASSMRSSLVGTWQLLSCELRTVGGAVTYPWGPDAIAYLIYTEDGHVSYQVAVANRPNFSSTDLFGGTDQEKIAAAETFQSYCGTYDLQADRVVHHVKVSSFPNWVGADQVRLVQQNGDELVLSSAPFVIAGATQTAHLSWRRAAPARVAPIHSA
jgi:predicted ester cyclase